MKLTANKVIEIWKKTEGKCFYCGKNIDNRMHIDHFHSVSEGGNNITENLVPCCKSCNLSKSNHDIIDFKERQIYKSLDIEPFTAKQKIFLKENFNVDIQLYIDDILQTKFFYFEKMNLSVPDENTCIDYEERK